MSDISTSEQTKNDQTKRANERPKNAPTIVHGPGPRAVEKAVSFGPSLRRLLGYLKPRRAALNVVVLMGVLGVAFSVVNPKVLGRGTDIVFAGVIGKTLPAGTTKQQVVDRLRTQGKNTLADLIASLDLIPGQGVDFHLLARVLGTVLTLYIVSAGLLFLQGWLLNRVVQNTVYDLRNQVSAKLDSLPLSYFDRQPRGELLSRVTNDIDNVSQSLQQTLTQLLNSTLTVIGVMVMMVTISWQLALISFTIIPVSGFVSAQIGKRAQKRFVTMWDSTGELNAHIEESFTGHSLVTVFGRRNEMERHFDETNERLYQAAFGAQIISGLIMPINVFIGNLNYVAVAVIGGLKVTVGTLALGSVQAFIQYSRMFTHPISQIASMANLLQSGIASAERVFEVLDATEQTADESGQLPEDIKGRIVFDEVDFSYDPAKKLIEKLSFTALPGQTVAIVGPTGAGKTTLVNLLERFYEIDDGTITLDGVNIANVPRHQLRSTMGMVLQDTWLFGGTIRDNIAYGKANATDEDILIAAKAAYVDRFVHSLPKGYDTVIDDEGTNISTGEKQLVTIARAFIADPAVLILDEATSSVDTRTEILVQKALSNLRAGRTSFVIAHRLSTIRQADVILVMDEGSIVEQGTHRELLETRGTYYALYQSQFSPPSENSTE